MYSRDKPKFSDDNYRNGNKNHRSNTYQQNYDHSDYSNEEPRSFNDGSTIYVANISSVVRQSEFERFFSKFGNIVFSTLKKDHITGNSKGFGFVKYETSNIASKAIQKSNGMDYFGKKLHVQPSKKSYKYENKFEHNNQRRPSRSLEKMRDRNFARKPSYDSYKKEKFKGDNRPRRNFNEERFRKGSDHGSMDRKNQNFVQNWHSQPKEKIENDMYDHRNHDKFKPKYKGIGTYKNKERRHSNSRSMDSRRYFPNKN